MLDAAKALLFFEIIDDAPLGVQIDRQGVFLYIVKKVKVKIIYAAFLELLLKNGLGIVGICNLMAGEFCGKIPAFPGIFRQDTTDDPLRFAVVVGIGGIKIIDAMVNGVGSHIPDLGLVDGSVRKCG